MIDGAEEEARSLASLKMQAPPLERWWCRDHRTLRTRGHLGDRWGHWTCTIGYFREAGAAEQLGTVHVDVSDLRPEVEGELIFLLFESDSLVFQRLHQCFTVSSLQAAVGFPGRAEGVVR